MADADTIQVLVKPGIFCFHMYRGNFILTIRLQRACEAIKKEWKHDKRAGFNHYKNLQ